MEKPLAAAAGIGWQGRHTNLVSRDFGSWLFLGSIFTTLDLPPTRRRWIIAARAAPASTPARPGRSTAAKSTRGCASPISPSRPRRRFPKFAGKNRQPHLWLRRLPRRLPVEQVRANRARGEIFGARRSGRAAAEGTGGDGRGGVPPKIFGQSGQAHRPCAFSCAMCCSPSAIPAIASLAPLAQARLGHESPLVRGMAVWALARLLPRDEFATLAARNHNEPDPDVRAEWGMG